MPVRVFRGTWRVIADHQTGPPDTNLVWKPALRSAALADVLDRVRGPGMKRWPGFPERW